MGFSAAARETVSQPQALDNLQLTPIDLKHLRRYTLGDASLEREILDLFLNQLPQTIGALAGAVDQRECKIAAHTLKGSGRAVGAWRIARIAEQAEHSQGLASPAHVGETVRLLEEAAEEARSFIKATYG